MKKILLALGLLSLAAALFMAWFVPSAFFGTPAGTTANLVVPEGATADEVSELLARRGIVASGFGYRIYGLLDTAARNPRAGSYEIAPGTSYRVIARQLALGPERDEVQVRVLEGATLNDVANELIRLGVSATSARDLIGDARIGKVFPQPLRAEFSFLKDLPTTASLEGYLFPDTYRVWKDQLPLGMILKQLKAFSEKTEGMADEAKRQGRTFADVVTLASIVEKEGRTMEERKVIAGIFLNRIKVGMRLQSDATVNYATQANRARPTYDDLENDSLYNTYRHDGLPPGPICNPGLDALQATLDPTATEYLYYLHDGQGKIYYARNIDEHRENRRKAFNE